MQEFQQRVIQEKAELEDKLKKLEAFLKTPAFQTLDRADQLLLWEQEDVMAEYAVILTARIARFTEISEAPHGQTDPR